MLLLLLHSNVSSTKEPPPPPRSTTTTTTTTTHPPPPPPLPPLRRQMPRSASAREGDMSWFWLSQTDITPGFWATPWHSIGDLNPQTCIAAVAVLTETLHHCTGDDNTNILRYVPFSSGVFGDTIAAMMSGVRTYPAYAHRGDGAGGGGGGGGVVCAGAYATIPHPRAFPTSRRIPTVNLLVSYRYQTDHAAAAPRRADAAGRLALPRGADGRDIRRGRRWWRTR